MASMSTAICLLKFHHQSSVSSLMPSSSSSSSSSSSIYKSKNHYHHRRVSSVVVNGGVEMKFHFGSSSTSCCCYCLSWNHHHHHHHHPLGRLAEQSFLVRASSSSDVDVDVDVDKQQRAAGRDGDVEMIMMQGGKGVVDSRDLVTRFRGTITTTLNNPAVLLVKQQLRTNFAVILCIAIACLVIAVREYVGRKSRHNHHGSVADLVKRGQLRSDRRGISKPLKYDDPFNNPLVKVSKNSSTVEMCGKVYRLAPVTLTQEEQSDHQKRRSRAYQWKRPTMFLKEGDSLPPDVDPDTVRWIPANHPFATTVNDIDEDLAQNNVYQKHGVPFRIKAEHEALQKKLESLQSEQKLNKLVVDPHNARDFERPFKSSSKSHEHVDRRTTSSQGDDPNTPKSDRTIESSPTDEASSEELKKP